MSGAAGAHSIAKKRRNGGSVTTLFDSACYVKQLCFGLDSLFVSVAQRRQQ